MKRIALITPTHLARNPRIVKEADALAAAGYEVDVFSCRFMEDVVAHDRLIEERAAWRSHVLSYTQAEDLRLYWISRIRQHLCRRVLLWLTDRPLRFCKQRNYRVLSWLALRTFERVYPELQRLVDRHDADLYIAHNLQALPVAYHAARRRGALLGFDAEDFHTGMFLEQDRSSFDRRLVVAVEDAYIRACDYLTAAAPLIAEAYVYRYEVAEPTSVLNAFPSAMRPAAFRATDAEAPLTLYWFSQTIGPVRGLEDASLALAEVADLPVELHLRGRVADPDYLAYLKALAGESAHRIKVHDLAPADEMIRLAANYDVGLALETPVEHNRDICLPNKIFSYLAAGNAVLAAATTAQAELMTRIHQEGGPVGAVYRPGDAHTLALQIRQWHESRDILDRCRRRAWNAATDRYNWDREQESFLRVISRVFSTAGDGSGRTRAGDASDGARVHARAA